MVRLVFMGTPEFAAASLQALLDAGWPPVGVVTQPDRPAGRGNLLREPPVKRLALAAGIEVIQPLKVKTGALIRATLQRWAPDLIIVAAYGRILPRDLLDLPPLGCVNIHASLLPRHRGSAPIAWALLQGDRETGISLMRMDEGIDTGPVYATAALAVSNEQTAADVHDRLAALGGRLLVDNLPQIVSGRLAAQPQPTKGATQAPTLTRADGQLDWQRSATELCNRVRALHPWPGTFTWLAERLLKVFPPVSPIVWPSTTAEPGTLLATDGGMLTVACGEGALRLNDVQLAGKKRMLASDFLRGTALLPGARLGRP